MTDSPVVPTRVCTVRTGLQAPVPRTSGPQGFFRGQDPSRRYFRLWAFRAFFWLFGAKIWCWCSGETKTGFGLVSVFGVSDFWDFGVLAVSALSAKIGYNQNNQILAKTTILAEIVVSAGTPAFDIKLFRLLVFWQKICFGWPPCWYQLSDQIWNFAINKLCCRTEFMPILFSKW